MTRVLRLSDDLALPLDVAGEAIAILAKRGAGKTNTGRVLVEELVKAHVQSVVLDPVGSWWGLRHGRERAEGLSLPIIGGQHADVPLEATAGAVIADVVVDSGQSFVVDLSDSSEFPSRAATNRFVADFAERLYRRKSRAPSLIHLVLEEADEFAPQKIRKDDKTAARMLGAMEAIVRRGRSRGLGVTFITQRSAVLNKDVLTQADVLIVMRTTGPQDVKAIKEWIAYHAEEDARAVLASLGSLRDGEAWIWNPERGMLERVQIRLSHSFDSGATPKAGRRVSAPTEAAPIDLALLGEQIAATVERAKLNDPAELQRKIRELEGQLAAAHRAPPEISKVEVPVPVFPAPLKDAIRRDYEGIASYIDGVRAHVEEMLIRAREHLDEDFGLALEIAESVPRPAAPAIVRAREAQPAPAPARARPTGDGTTLSRPQQKILDALLWFEAIGVAAPKRAPLAAVAGVSSNSSGYRANISTLSGLGLIRYPESGHVELTEDGRASASAPSEMATVESLQDAICNMVSGPQAALLRVLIVEYPRALSREYLAERACVSFSSSGFRANVSTLSGFGFLEYPEPGTVKAHPLLFARSE